MASWNRVSVWLAGAAVALAAQSALAAPVVFNFDGLSDSDVVTNQFPGLTFTHAKALTAGISLNDADYPPRSGTNVLVDDGGAMVISFGGGGVASVGAYFTYAQPLTFVAFDSGHNVLGSVTSAFSVNAATVGDPGSSPNELLSIAVGGASPLIASLEITGDVTGGSFVLDDLTLDLGAAGGGGGGGGGGTAPEPTSVALAGLALAGLVASRRRRSVPTC